MVPRPGWPPSSRRHLIHEKNERHSLYSLANQPIIDDTMPPCRNDREKIDTKLDQDHLIPRKGREKTCLRRLTAALTLSVDAKKDHLNILRHQEEQEICPRRQIRAVAISGDTGKKNLFPPLTGPKDSLDLHPTIKGRRHRNSRKQFQRLP